MATTSKAFRTRAFDANKPMAVLWACEVKDIAECSFGNRAVTQMPTGMEKEEEMESHLQDAIIAQQAGTSGIQLENHIIPTPKVIDIDTERYNKTYISRPKSKTKEYIRVHSWISLERDEPEYDIDSEDEQWLSEQSHIDPTAMERIFDVLEAQSSDNSICLPATALRLLPEMDGSVFYDVYDYWLTKRRDATTSYGNIGIGGLIPRIRTEVRKDGPGACNPYVAFRRRAEKMQTRKNRKNDEDNYEKLIKLLHDFQQSDKMMESLQRREKTKLALIDSEISIFAKRMQLGDFGSNFYNEFNARVRGEVTTSKLASQMNGTIISDDGAKKKKKFKRRIGDFIEGEVPTKAWLKKNEELWNKPPPLFGSATDTPAPTELGKAVQDLMPDGKYTFKRRRGCVYRAARSFLPSALLANEQKVIDEVPKHMRFYKLHLPRPNGETRAVYTRKRIGRLGRILFDRIHVPDDFEDEPGASVDGYDKFDPWAEDCIIDTRTTFRATLKTMEEEDERQYNAVDQVFNRSDKYRFEDQEFEALWAEQCTGISGEVIENDEREEEPMELDEPKPSVSGKWVPKDAPVLPTVASPAPVPVAPLPPTQTPAPVQVPTTVPTNINPPAMVVNGNAENGAVPTEAVSVSTPFQLDGVAGVSSSLSGNVRAGRADPTPTPIRAPGMVSESDNEWREPSGSPSESNSSTEWHEKRTSSLIPVGGVSGGPPTYSMMAKQPSGEDRARTGDHPVACEPIINGVKLPCQPYIRATPTIGS